MSKSKSQEAKVRLRLGFTLLELLVVISIMGILMALGAVAYTTAQKKGRDARRRGDMKAIQSAFEQYYGANTSYDATCANMAVDPYMAGGLPNDPKPGSTYVGTCTETSYCYCAELENETGNASDSDCSWGSSNYYCVANQQ